MPNDAASNGAVDKDHIPSTQATNRALDFSKVREVIGSAFFKGSME
jgi:hypothetical protein